MKTAKKGIAMHSLAGVVLGVGVLLAATAARAEGVVLTSGALDAAARTQLQTQVASVRALHPEAFRAVYAVDTFKPEAVARSRHAQPTTARAFMRLGPPALMPMLEMLVLNVSYRGLSLNERRALGDGLIQAVGVLKDERARRVLQAVFLKSSEPRWVTSAAVGLGMLCRGVDRALLLRESAAGQSRSQAAIAGLGHCRAEVTAQRLASALRESLGERSFAATAARSLGYVGSSWALAADASVAKSKAARIRTIASRALVEAFPRVTGDTRRNVERSLLMVEDPASVQALRRLEQLQASSTELRRDARRLRLRLERNLQRAGR